METIKNYLDNMFASLPKTARVAELKDNIQSNMEDKYNELKRQGKTENEAIGIVISEFGNIDELINELGIRKEDAAKSQLIVTQEEVDAYLNVKKTMALQIGIGVVLCLIGPALLILITKLISDGFIDINLTNSTSAIPGLVALFLFITAAVGIFIYSGMNFERYKYMEEGVQLPSSVESNLKEKYYNYNRTFYLSILAGVCLLILSPVILVITSLVKEEASEYGVVVLLIIVAVAIFLFIFFGTIRESYERMLKLNDYSEKHKKENKVIGAVASIVWPLAVVIFLLCGFVYGLWQTAWIVFPITGILFGMFSAAYSIITGNNGQ
jgi:uncharacterized membrane protein YcjF (UPF0283 family)